MIQFRGVCPRCNKLSLVDTKTPCSNILGNGSVCGYALTTDVASGNSLFRRKEAKHTNPPPSGAASGVHSWTNSGLYDVHQTAALASGNLCYDTVNNYFCLTAPLPSGEARVRYLKSGTTEDAWLINMPLNSKWPNLHLHYRQDDTGLIPIASGDFVVASSGILVSGAERKAYSIWQSGQVVAVYDPVASGLVTFG
jgi:hypothetical protein